MSREESLGKRIAKRIARNLAQFLKYFALGLLEAASDGILYTPSYEVCWHPEDSGYCICERRGMVPKQCACATESTAHAQSSKTNSTLLGAPT